MCPFVDYYAHHPKSGIFDEFEESSVEAPVYVRIAEHAKRTFAVYDVGTMQDYGSVGSRTEDSSFEAFKVIGKRNVVIGLLKPYTQKGKVSMRSFPKKLICVVTRLIDIEPIAGFLRLTSLGHVDACTCC